MLAKKRKKIRGVIQSRAPSEVAVLVGGDGVRLPPKWPLAAAAGIEMTTATTRCTLHLPGTGDSSPRWAVGTPLTAHATVLSPLTAPQRLSPRGHLPSTH